METMEVRVNSGSLFDLVTKWGVALIRVNEAIIGEHEAAGLRQAFLDAADRHEGRLILDASAISVFNCSWINTLLALSGRCSSKGGSLFVTGLTTQSLAVLRATGLHTRFKTAPSAEHALSNMGLTGASTWRMAVGDFFKRRVA